VGLSAAGTAVGSAAVYQALAAGTPVLGIPMNLDQYLMMHYLRRFESGDYIRAGLATAELVTRMVRRMDESAQYKTRAVQLSRVPSHVQRAEVCLAVDRMSGDGRVLLCPLGYSSYQIALGSQFAHLTSATSRKGMQSSLVG
jgi:predicted polyphosphate/ATP-dependent NAD kinase